MKEIEIDGISRRHILKNPIVSRFLEAETMGEITHEEAMCGMVNALADRNEELEKRILGIYERMPLNFLAVVKPESQKFPKN